MMERIAASPGLRSRIAGIFYLLTFIAGGLALAIRGRLGFVAVIIASICYVAVTLFFYDMFKPVNRAISLLAAIIGLAGCVAGAAGLAVNPLVFFGFYCLLIGYLILRSTFLPRILGALMLFAGLGWLTFLSATVANYLSPYNFAPGLLGEAALTVWLLLKGVNVERWNQQAGASRGTQPSGLPSSLPQAGGR